MKIQFLGASQSVTGSCYYIDTGEHKFLVDCGQFQGSQKEINKNYESLPFDPRLLDFIILTHGHIDHTGRLPILCRDGFSKRIYLTRATASLSEILLKDSAKIHEIECEEENKKRVKAGLETVEPFYTTEDAEYTTAFFNPIPLNKEIEINDDISVHFVNAGHLLGSANVYVTIKDEVILFSGDIGSSHSEILYPPTKFRKADYVIMETTYGNRVHKDMENRFRALLTLIKETIKKKGTVIIPAFSVGRTQDIIYGLKNLVENTSEYKEFLDIPFYVDSPMAINATKVYKKDTEDIREELVKKLNENIDVFSFPNLTFITEPKESIMLNKSDIPKVIISASGMCDAGRILHHLKASLPDKKTSIIFVGYQSEESLGRKIMNSENVIIGGEEVENNAEIHVLSGFSGHADQNELLDWVSHFSSLKKLFLVHGEIDSIYVIDKKIKDQFGYNTYIPELYETVEL